MYESGGHSDKLGNEYELNWVVRQLLFVLTEKFVAIRYEPAGMDGQGIDLVVEHRGSQVEGQQCKAYSPTDKWTLAGTSNVIDHSWSHLNNKRYSKFTFVTCSPVEYQPLLISARDSSSCRSFF